MNKMSFVLLFISLIYFGGSSVHLGANVTLQNRITLNTVTHKITDRNFKSDATPECYSNCIWSITQTNDLGGKSVSLPKNVSLCFEGKKLSNATLLGSETKITAYETNILADDLLGHGSWSIEKVNPIMFGATGDGITDDSDSLEKTLNFGGKIDLLNKNYLVTRELRNASDFELYNGTITSKAPLNSAIIVNASSNINVYDVESSGDVAFIRQTSDFNDITIHNSKFTGASNSVSNYLLTFEPNISGNSISLNENEIYQATLLFADDVFAEVCNVTYNYIFQPTRFVVRSLNQGSGKLFKIINFNNNRVYDINGDLTDKSNVARCLQIQTSEITNANNNFLDGAESTNAANFIYNFGGSLIARNNFIKNIKGHTDKSVIDDKSSVGSDKYFWKIESNTFDFTDIMLSESPEAVIRVNESKNVFVSNNKFRGLKCYAVRVYHSVDTGNYPENIKILNNKVYDSEFPVAFQIFQNIKNVMIDNNYVSEITNPTGVSISGRSEVRVVDVYQSFSNGSNLDGVRISGNVLETSASTAFILTLYRNSAALTSDIVNVSVTNNEMKSSPDGAFVRITGTNVSGFELMNNIGVLGVSETIGTEPDGTKKVNNKGF